MAGAGAPVGNTNAAKGKEFENALRRALKDGGRERVMTVAQKLVSAAEAGEAWAIQMVADRLDGKPKTEISGHVTGDHKHTHVAEAVSDTATWLDGLIRAGADSEAKEPLSH